MITAEFKPTTFSIAKPWIFTIFCISGLTIFNLIYYQDVNGQILKLSLIILILIFFIFFLNLLLLKVTNLYDISINANGIYSLGLSIGWREISKVNIKVSLGQKMLYFTKRNSQREHGLQIITKDNQGLYFALSKCIPDRAPYKDELLGFYKVPNPRVPIYFIKGDLRDHERERFKKIIIMCFIMFFIIFSAIFSALLLL